MDQQTSNFNFSNLFRYVMVALVFLIPVFFLPSTTFPLYSAKISMLATILVFLIALFLAKTLSVGRISIPKTKILLPLALFPVIALVSSFFSKNVMLSIVGGVFDVGTSGFILIMTLLFFLILFSVGGDRLTINQILKFFTYSGVVIVVHMLIRAFVAPVLPVSIASRIPNFLTGGAIDTSIILGAVILGILCLLHMSNVSKRMSYVVYATLALGLLIIGAINFTPVIFILGVFALVYFVLMFSWSIGNRENGAVFNLKNYIPALIVLVFSVVLLISGGAVSNYLSGVFNVNSFEVRPNFETTFEIVKHSLSVNPVLGVGPNKFSDMWNLYKPFSVNITSFWNTNFNFGSSLIATILSTIGILGFLSIIGFIIMYVIVGFRSLFAGGEDREGNYLTVTTFFLSIFFWAMTFVYVPGIASITLAFVFSALSLSLFSSRGILGVREFNLFNNPKANFVSVFGIVFCLIMTIAGGYFVWQRNISANLFQKGLVLVSGGDLQGAKLKMARAIQMSPNDSYWRNLSELTLLELSQVLGGISNPQNISETKRAEIQTVISNSIEASRQAIALNPNNYQNWMTLGRVYEALASVGIQGALDNARSAYVEVKNRAPNNPMVPLSLARLELINGNVAGAREFINQALQLKSNYTDAYFILAQIEVASNNIPNAIRSVEAATLTDPNNANLYFQLGMLKYNNRDHEGAAAAFERAVSIIPDYANARYFLGLSYDRLGRAEDAIAQFREIQRTNPDNQEVVLILSNLEAGRDPFYSARPPVDDSPEDRPEPPIEN